MSSLSERSEESTRVLRGPRLGGLIYKIPNAKLHSEIKNHNSQIFLHLFRRLDTEQS